ncbi:MAG: protein kinase [Planctomycetota bacterium]
MDESSTRDASSSDPSEPLDQAIADYYSLEDEGRAPPLEEFLSRYPEIRTELEEFFRAEGELRELRPILRSDSRAQSTPPDSLLPNAGEIVGNYEIVEELGRGGMGVVYRARQIGLDREVALKLLPVGPQSTETERIRLEAEVTASLDHPNIVPIFEFGQDRNCYFIALKLIDGESLDRQLNRFKNRYEDAAHLIETLANAVQFAHDRGVLHRDLKPANVILDADGTPHLTDFGLAKMTEGDSGVTQTGAVVGTPRYMAPEQTAGRRDALSSSVDIYSLGAVFYELLTGEPPFQGNSSFEILAKVVSEDPSRPRRRSKDVPIDLESICLKCLEKDPARRYASARALAEDLARYRRGEPVEARPVSWAVQTAKWSRRHPAVASLGAVSVLALITVALLSWQHSRELEEFIDELRHYQYADRMRQLESERTTGQLPKAQASLDATSPRPGRADLRGFEWYYHRSALELDTQFKLDPQEQEHSRNTVSVARKRGILGVRLRPDAVSCFKLSTREIESEFEVASDTLSFELSPDGASIVYLAPRHLVIASQESKNVVELSLSMTQRVLTVSPDFQRFVVGDSNSERTRVLVFDRNLRAQEVVFRDEREGQFRSGHVDTSRDELYALHDGNPDLALRYSLRDDTQLPPIPYTTTPRGWRAALFAERSGLLIGAGFSEHPKESGVGPVLEAFSRDSLDTAFRLAAPEDRHLRLETIDRIDLSSDERLLLAGTDKGVVQVWDLETKNKVREFQAHQGRMLDVEFFEDDSSFVTSAKDGNVRFWPTKSDRGRLPDVKPGKPFVDVASLTENSVLVIRDEEEVASLSLQPGRSTQRLDPAAKSEEIGPFDKYATASNGSRFCLVTREGLLRIYKTRKTSPPGWDLEHEFVRNSRCRGAEFSPDGERLVVSFYDETSALFETDNTGTWSRTDFEHPDGSTHFFAISGDGRLAVGAAAFSDWVTVFDLDDVAAGVTPVAQWKPGSRPRSLAIDDHSNTVALATELGTVEVWNLETREIFVSFQAHTDSMIHAVTYSPDGSRLVTGSERGEIKLWDLAVVNGEPTALHVGSLRGHRGEISKLRFDATGETLYSVGGVWAAENSVGEIGIWRAKRGDLR